MRGQHCSWVDMIAIRQALAMGNRGDQAVLERIRCVTQSAVSRWKAACNVMAAVEGKHDIYHVSHFQPAHAVEIGRAFRRREKDASKWDADEVARWVERCEDERWTVPELRKQLLDSQVPSSETEGCTVADLAELVASGKRFGCIYADPPWKYGNQATRASTDRHYATMTFDEIVALPVAALTAESAHLHLWTTNAFLPDAFRLMASWGFTYKSLFVWCKGQSRRVRNLAPRLDECEPGDSYEVTPQIGIGNYWRVSTEYLLLGVRGNCPFRDRSLRNYAVLPRGEHSAKPDEVRKMVERASPGPWLELFARISTPGWTVWGNQIDRNRLFNGSTV